MEFAKFLRTPSGGYFVISFTHFNIIDNKTQTTVWQHDIIKTLIINCVIPAGYWTTKIFAVIFEKQKCCKTKEKLRIF